MKLAKNHSKIDKTHPLSVGMAAMHTTSSLDREMLQISSFGELEYSSVQCAQIFHFAVKLHKNKDSHVSLRLSDDVVRCRSAGERYAAGILVEHGSILPILPI